MRPTLSKRKILTYTSLSYSTFEVLNSCPLHNAKGPHRLQVVKPENKTETFRSSPTGDGARQSWRKHKQVAEMFHKCCRIVADLSQNTEFLFRFCFVSLVWTRPKATNTQSEYAILPAFSTATMVARMCLTVTFYVHCLSCLRKIRPSNRRQMKYCGVMVPASAFLCVVLSSVST